jgi:hypothetical protein
MSVNSNVTVPVGSSGTECLTPDRQSEHVRFGLVASLSGSTKSGNPVMHVEPLGLTRRPQEWWLLKRCNHPKPI